MKSAYIDQIRGIAILFVILVHTSQSISIYSNIIEMILKYGQMGVQLFFLASAYTLCQSFFNRQNEKKSFMKFYIRRYFRIAPLYYIAIIMFTILNLVIYNKIGNYTLKNILANILLIHGLYPPANNNIVPGGWSIGVEILFYIIFPFLITFINRYFIKYGIKSLWIFFYVSIGINLIVQLIIFILLGLLVHRNNFIYYSILNQFPVFILGIITYYTQEKTSSKIYIQIFWFFIFTILSISLWFTNNRLVFAIMPVISGISFTYLFRTMKYLNLNLNILQTIGKFSYSIYIFHFIVIHYITNNLFKIFNITFPPTLLLFIVFSLNILLSAIIANFSRNYIEIPGINFGNKIINSLKSK